MFLGEYQYTVDHKGRVPIPPRFRPALAEGLVVSQGIDECIVVYPLEEWERIASRLAALPMTQSNSRRLMRGTFSKTFSLNLDRQGRVMLPNALREHARIREEAVIAGINKYLEIWARDRWITESELIEKQVPEIAESVEMPE